LLLELTSKCNFLYKYVLVGGSALTLHLCHRKSEDLDFFTYYDTFDKKEIVDYINKFEENEILNEGNEQIDILLNGVKVTFFNSKWSFLKPEIPSQFNLAPLEAIAAMKVNALFLRARYRDYYDLYFLVKNGLSLKQIFENSKNIIKSITFKIFATALIYIDDIEDENILFFDPKEKISKEDIRDFFQRQLQNIV
jgi:predicted nucleotidyltransferase component of viral defense system